MATIGAKPILILVAAGIRAGAGSEPSKGWAWAHALAKFYQLEIITLPFEQQQMALHGAPEGSRVHGVGENFSPGPAWRYYPSYQKWCRLVVQKCEELVRERPVAGLHHITLGSFRVMPRYDRLKIPYTLGPIGGGEVTAWPLLPRLRLPPREILAEAARLPANYAFALVPGLRAVFGGAELTLATTAQSSAVVSAMGARRTGVVFPDALDFGAVRDTDVLAVRAQQMESLGECLQCVCAGRALWWKGMHLAIDFMQALQNRGINARLDIFTQGKALAAWRARAESRGVAARVTFHPMIPRDDLMARYANCHLFLNPTMHDSSSPALVEAYATGLPSMTLGLAGATEVATAQTGLNDPVGTIPQWLDLGCGMVAAWRSEPARWYATCESALRRRHDFTPAYLEHHVREYLVPIFSPAQPGI